MKTFALGFELMLLIRASIESAERDVPISRTEIEG
jgi:hypothetical protein